MTDQLNPSLSEIASRFTPEGQIPDVEAYDMAWYVHNLITATEVQAQEAADSSAVTGK
jgi:hypothetical protein